MLEFTSRMARCSGVAAFSSTMACTRPSESRKTRPYSVGSSSSAVRIVAAASPRRCVSRSAAEFLSAEAEHRPERQAQLRASANRATRDLHGVPCARCGCCRTVCAPSSVTTALTSFAWFPTTTSNCAGLSGRQARTTCSTSGSPPRDAGLSPARNACASFAGSQQYDCGVFCDHLADIVASSRSFSNRNSGTL